MLKLLKLGMVLVIGVAFILGCKKTKSEVDEGYIALVNSKNSIESIKELYLREEGSNSWGKNIFSKKLDLGTQRKITIDNCGKSYDVKAIYENNKDISRKKIYVECGKEENVLFWLYQSTIPEENIDCTQKGKSKMLDDIMKDTYLWYEHTPSLDYESYTDMSKLLDDLKYKKYDRWSYITTVKKYTDYYESGTYGGTGFYFYYYNNYTAYIRFVYKNSPADKAGLKRGVEILAINEKTIQEITEEKLWSTIFGKDEIGVELKLKVKKDSQIKNIVLQKDTVKINTVLKDEILEVGNKKVGYLVFNKFLEPSREELKTVFTKFKQENIDELILDLRYNGGGRLGVAKYLASLIGGDKTVDNVFETLQYNDKFTHKNSIYKFTKEKYSLGLSKVYVIGTRKTASASEFLINGLKPFLDVYVIGSRTHGKPVGMNGYSFCDKRVEPIMFKGVNANEEGDYFEGITVTCNVRDNLFYDFGDTNEPMLKETIYYMQNGKCSPLKKEKLREEMKVNQDINDEIYRGFRGEIGAF